MYDKLIGMFKVNNASQILFLKNKLKDIETDKGECIQSYFMRITKIKNDMLSIREVIVDRELTLIALGGLSRPCVDIFITAIINNYRIPGFDELLVRCTQEETRMMERDKSNNGNEPTTFSTHAKRKNDVNPRRHGQGSKKGFKGRGKGRCYNCNMFGHCARECPHKKNPPRDVNHKNNNFKSIDNKRNNRYNNKGKRNAPIAREGNIRPPRRTRNASEASRHFTRYKEALSNLVEKKTNLKIIFGDNATYPMKGIGTVTLHLNYGQTIHLQEVLYVPDLKKNLVSISVMEDQGFKVEFIDGKVSILHRNPKYAFTLGFRLDGIIKLVEVL
eukprot:PITA_01802